LLADLNPTKLGPEFAGAHTRSGAQSHTQAEGKH